MGADALWQVESVTRGIGQVSLNLNVAWGLGPAPRLGVSISGQSGVGRRVVFNPGRLAGGSVDERAAAKLIAALSASSRVPQTAGHRLFQDAACVGSSARRGAEGPGAKAEARDAGLLAR